MLIPTWTLAAACIGIGLMAGMVVPPILGVAATVAGLGETADVPLVEDALRGASSVTAFAVFLLVVVALAAVSRRWLIGRVDVRSDDTWGCAYSLTTPRMQYTASSFAAPLIRMFGWLAGVREHRGGTVYHSGARDLVLDDLARPAWRVVQRAALRLRPMQQGRLHLYLLYVVAALIALLLYLVAAPQARP